MIIVRSPLRISLGGGGTDLPSYYNKKEGFFISAAIDRYVYVTITRPFSKGIYLKYSKIEKTNEGCSAFAGRWVKRFYSERHGRFPHEFKYF